MSDSAWDKLNTVLGLLLALVLLSGFTWAVWSIAALNARDALNAERRADQHAAEAQQTIERACAGLEPPALTKCIEEIVKASQEAERSEYDLAAQEAMARWAGWMVAVTGLTFLITGLGVFLVWSTLLETRRRTGFSFDIRRMRHPVHDYAMGPLYGDTPAKEIILQRSFVGDITPE